MQQPRPGQGIAISAAPSADLFTKMNASPRDAAIGDLDPERYQNHTQQNPEMVSGRRVLVYLDAQHNQGDGGAQCRQAG